MVQMLLVVACALRDSQERILVAQRPKNKSYAGMWEFPGGKIENKETPQEALKRELIEELGIIVSTHYMEPLTFSSKIYDDCCILLCLYGSRMWEGEASPKEQQILAWKPLKELAELPLLPANYAFLPHIENWIDTPIKPSDSAI
jgi:8-oxo-dGTP diphosphatase